MFCTKCGRENPEKNKFCNGCGRAIVAGIPVKSVPAPPPPPVPGIAEVLNVPTTQAVVFEQHLIEDTARSSPGSFFDDHAEVDPEVRELEESAAVEIEPEVEEESSLAETDLSPPPPSEQIFAIEPIDEHWKSGPELVETKNDELTEPADGSFPTLDEDPDEPLPGEDHQPSFVIGDFQGFVDEAETRLDEVLSESWSGGRDDESNDPDEVPDFISLEPEKDKSVPSLPIPSLDAAYADEPKRGTRNKAGYVGAGLALLLVGAGAIAFSLGDEEEDAPGRTLPTAAITPSLTPAGPTNPPAGMVYIPGGEFLLGSDQGDDPFSKPAHTVKVQPFFIDTTEVTNEQYMRFTDATGHNAPPIWINGTFPTGEARFPVRGVDWNDATAFARWSDKRLPTEAEWEFAARGISGNLYPWGNAWDAAKANAGSTDGPREVGQSARSPYGLYDTSGNVWEWTSSDAAPYPGGKPQKNLVQESKIIRGGSWKSSRVEASSIYRAIWRRSGETDYNATGIRCAKSL